MRLLPGFPLPSQRDREGIPVEMWTPPPDDQIRLETVDDALDFALVAELFRPFDRLLALADGDARVRVVIVDPTDGLLHQCGAIGLPGALVVSRSEEVGAPLRESDIAAFRALHARFARQRVRLVDWIHMSHDAQLFRSMAVSIDARARDATGT